LTLTQGALFGAAALLPAYNAQDYYRDLTATNAEQAQNPLFPAGLRLKTGLGDLDVNSLRGPLPTSASCGVSGCHPVAFQQWSASAHRFAGSDPLYAASLKESIKTSGPGIRTWCQSCHAPSEVVQQALQSGGASFKSRESEGVGCYACHGTVGTPTRTGDGRFVLAEPMDYPFAGDTGWRGKLHDFLIRVRPGPHQRAFLKPDLHRSSEFCSSCHRQSLTLAQNHYRFVRGPDEYGEWARGPASARSARTADSRPARTCQECHFRAQAGGRISVSHTSLGGISGLGGTMGHASNLEANGAQLRKAISLDIIAIRRIRPDGLPGETIAPLNSPHGPYELAAGTACLLDIVVRNQGVGHSFPAGYTDLTEAWLEVTIPDANGKPLLSNGTLSSGQSIIPPDAHSYGSLGLDKKGNPVLKHNLPMQVTEAYHRTIPAGGADVARYRFVVPRLLTRSGSKHESIRLSARLRYRSVRPDFLRWARGQTSRPGNARDISSTPAILTLAETEIALPLEGSEPASHAASSEDEATLADRFVRYGYGLLAPVEKPDIRGAKYAFDRAKEISPTSPDSWIGSGRAFLAEREFILAARNFEGAMALSPGNGAASAELSVIYRKQGQFDRAIGVLTPLVDRYPNDAALRYEQGLALFGAGRYRDAAESFRASLAIDPDQSEVHSHLKLCYDVLRRAPEGRLEDSITRYLGEDLLAAQLVPAYLKKHPEVAQRAAPFPIHELR
jgi:Tfp pilus assembly protein PilF